MRNIREQRLLRFGPLLAVVAVTCELKVLIDGAPVFSLVSAALLTSSGMLIVLARDAMRRDG